MCRLISLFTLVNICLLTCGCGALAALGEAVNQPVGADLETPNPGTAPVDAGRAPLRSDAGQISAPNASSDAGQPNAVPIDAGSHSEPILDAGTPPANPDAGGTEDAGAQISPANDAGQLDAGANAVDAGQTITLDQDDDGVPDGDDNCPALFNPTQDNADGDATGDACDCIPAQPDNLELVFDGPLSLLSNMTGAPGFQNAWQVDQNGVLQPELDKNRGDLAFLGDFGEVGAFSIQLDVQVENQREFFFSEQDRMLGVLLATSANPFGYNGFFCGTTYEKGLLGEKKRTQLGPTSGTPPDMNFPSNAARQDRESLSVGMPYSIAAWRLDNTLGCESNIDGSKQTLTKTFTGGAGTGQLGLATREYAARFLSARVCLSP